MKVLLVHPPWAEAYGSYKAAAKVGNPYPPLGLCYLAATLDRSGHTTAIIDAELEGESIDAVVKRARRFEPDIIGLTATTSIFHIAQTLAKAMKGALPETPLLLGGPHITALPEQSMIEATEFDFGLVGEAEESFPRFVDCLLTDGRWESVPGLIYRGDGELHINPIGELLHDLDSLPLPARHKLDLDCYRWSAPGKGIVRFTSIMSSRGCPFECIFCSAHTVFGRRVRYRSIEGILDELEECVSRYDIRHFAFIDDTLTLNHERVSRLCSGIIERGLDITWEGWTRANTVNYELLKTMRSAGFVRVSFGIESANPQIAKRIKKRVPLESYGPAYEAARRARIETRGSIILGMPGETRKTALETLRFAVGLRDCQQLYINIATPYPATELYDMARKGEHGMRLLTDDFAQYRRYGKAVIEVNDLDARALSRLQRLGFLAFYLTPGRILYNARRAGLKAFVKNAIAFVRSVVFS